MDKTKWKPIPGFSRYLVNIDNLQVYSGYVGRILVLMSSRDGHGYHLWEDKAKYFISQADLRNIVNFIMKENVMAQIVTRAPKKGEYIVGSINKQTGVVSNTPIPAIHTNLELAKTEAARLAVQFKDRKFVVFQAVAIVSVDDVKWE